MNDSMLILGVRAAGVFHLLSLVAACFTPIPAAWDENRARLPAVHRRFAVAQNFAVGATIAFCGLVCLCFAPALVTGTTTARILCAAVALWWGGRLVILPWLRVWPELRSTFLRVGFVLLCAECVGFVLLCAECAIYAVAFGWLALRAR